MQLGQTHDVNRWYASCNLAQRMMQIKAMDITNVLHGAVSYTHLTLPTKA